MKKILFLLILGTATLSFAQNAEKKGPPPGKALVGDAYGAKVSAKAKAISTKDLQNKVKKNGKAENVVVKAKVTEVCPNKGCWLTLQTDNNERFFVKMKDYAFFVPTALKGKNVILEGTAEEKTLSVEEAKHYAEDAKKTQAEIDAITEPQKEIRFMASGIKVVK
ncbi:DUF4920 domain-containing protein [Chryseobacterium taklimakanense]|uniref:DUF4920 domain-containing protein n=1 Tax=Chryseobacterium taklimakanense TaxID=536441 RepID=UPI0023F8C6F2|nr:DUF4920 domain-containing protein [Chryseobacterium taklimakanense]